MKTWLAEFMLPEPLASILPLAILGAVVGIGFEFYRRFIWNNKDDDEENKS
jgi:hypothetical protein